MLVMVGPDVPEALAEQLGERFHVVRSTGMLEADASPERLFFAAQRNGVAAIVTNDEPIHEETRRIKDHHEQDGGPGPPMPFEVLRWREGDHAVSDLAKELSAIERRRGEEESLLSRLSEETRRERGYRSDRRR